MKLALGLLGLLAAASCGSAEPPRPNVLLITIDTLRADHVGAYGYARATTPRLDEFARECVVLDRAQSPRAKTTPAIASLLTGLYPHAHGVRDLASPLASNVPLLPDALREHDYATGAIVGNWVLGDARSGLARGFDVWCESLPDTTGVPPDGAPQRRASGITDAALVALGLAAAPADPEFEPRVPLAREGRPWFLWLHYMDPHGAYEPPEEHRVFEREAPDPVSVSDDDANGPHRKRVALYNVPEQAWIDSEHVDAARVRDLYDGEIRYADSEIGRLLDRLRESGALDSTVVIVTADHGESLGEHRYWFEHGAYAYESTVRVPLLVRAPGLAARRCGEPFSLADLAPTLCELLEIERDAPEGLAGASKLAAWRGTSIPAAAIYCEKVEAAHLDGAVQHKAVRLGDWKLIQRYASRTSADGARRETLVVGEELYDLAADPLESFDLSAAPGAAPIESLRRELARFVAEDRGLAELGALLAARRKGLEISDPDAARTLRLLGY